jgi:ribosome-associated translation inhibitor RaiA
VSTFLPRAKCLRRVARSLRAAWELSSRSPFATPGATFAGTWRRRGEHAAANERMSPMQNPLQITFRGMQPSEAVERRIRSRADELERFHDQIMSCHVTVDAPHRQHQQGNLFSVHLDIRVPQGEIVVNRETGRNHAHEDAYVAIRDAFDAAVRQLEDYARRQRGKIKRHEVVQHGKITKLSPHEGFGFVETSEGLEVYFHRNCVTDGAFDKLNVGDEVRVVIAEGQGEQGPQASTITRVGKHHIVD